MKQSLGMKFVMMRAEAERNAAHSHSIIIEHIFLGLLKLAELNAENIYEAPDYLLIQTNKDISTVQHLFKQNNIDTARTRNMLRTALATGAITEAISIQEYISEAEKLSEAEHQDRLEAHHVLQAILQTPTDLILQFCPIPGHSCKGPIIKDPQSISFLPELTSKIRSMRAQLLAKIFGQDHVIHAFAEGIFAAEVLAAADEKRIRPRAIFAFVGPPGVGKTFLAEESSKILELPYKRFDMSSYSDHQSYLGLIGFEKSYKDASEGTLTGFVKRNPHCMLLFDEIEKAHLNTIHLFLQILDAGRLSDRFLDEDVSFKDTIIIFTSNAGRSLYEGDALVNAAGVPRNVILGALQTEINPQTKQPFFPAAITSRLATGWPMLFNHLQAQHLERIVSSELERVGGLFTKQFGIKVSFEKSVSNVLLMREGGLPDARTLRAQAELFFKNEIYKICRLWGEEHFSKALQKMNEVIFQVKEDGMPAEIAHLLHGNKNPELLLYVDSSIGNLCKSNLNDFKLHITQNIEEALTVAGKEDIHAVLLDISVRNSSDDELNQYIPQENYTGFNNGRRNTIVFDYAPLTDSSYSDGYLLFKHLRERLPDLPIYLLQTDAHQINPELEISFIRAGARGKLILGSELSVFEDQLSNISKELQLQKVSVQMAAEHKVLTFETTPQLKKSGREIIISLNNLALSRAVSGEDLNSVVDEIEKPDVRFSDVVGAKTAKEELQFFVEYLRNPKVFTAQGLKPPKGVLLYGPPGTGKTMLAKAMAGESNVAFIPAVASSFVTIWQGSGPQSVRDLFKKARKYAPSILFIDEIDAIGKKRGSLNRNAEEMALNALLTEMDGFTVDPRRPVFVLAATNFDIEDRSGAIGVIDEALSRRFDRKILVDLPNENEREQLIRILLAKNDNNQISDSMIKRVAAKSVGVSPSWIASVMEMAKVEAVKKKSPLTDDILDECFETVIYGEKKDWGKDYLERVARHECGHALINYLNGNPPSYLTIVARGDHGGYMEHDASENQPLLTKKQLEDRIRTSLGGRAAEIVYYGAEDGQSTGPSGDLKNATQIAQQMLCMYGMDEELGLCYLGQSKEYSHEILLKINELLNREMQKAIADISANRKKMDNLVSLLLKKNKLSKEEIMNCLDD